MDATTTSMAIGSRPLFGTYSVEGGVRWMVWGCGEGIWDEGVEVLGWMMVLAVYCCADLCNVLGEPSWSGSGHASREARSVS